MPDKTEKNEKSEKNKVVNKQCCNHCYAIFEKHLKKCPNCKRDDCLDTPFYLDGRHWDFEIEQFR